MNRLMFARWRDGIWMHGKWMDEWGMEIAEWIDEKMDKWKNEWKDKKWVDICIDGLIGSWRMDG